MNRKELVNALKTIVEATEKNDNISVSDSFVFNSDKISVYSGNMFFVYPISTNIECVIKAKETLKTLEKMETDEIEIKEKDGVIYFTGGKTKLKMNNVISDDAGLNIPIPNLSKLKFKKLNGDFFNGIEMCFYSIDSNSQVSYLSGVYVDKNKMWSSDDLKIGCFELENDYGYTFTLPYKACAIIKNPKNQPIEISVKDNWVYFKYDNGVIFGSSTILDKFPIERASEILKEYTDSEDYYEFPEDLEKSVDRVAVFANVKEDDDLPKIAIFRKGNELKVQGEKKFGSIEETIDISDCAMFNEDIVLRINPDLLKKMLSVTKKFTISDGVAAFKTENFIHVMSVSIE